jgi:hypothetical protein
MRWAAPDRCADDVNWRPDPAQWQAILTIGPKTGIILMSCLYYAQQNKPSIIFERNLPCPA